MTARDRKILDEFFLILELNEGFIGPGDLEKLEMLTPAGTDDFARRMDALTGFGAADHTTNHMAAPRVIPADSLFCMSDLPLMLKSNDSFLNHKGAKMTEDDKRILNEFFDSFDATGGHPGPEEVKSLESLTQAGEAEFALRLAERVRLDIALPVLH